MLNISIDFTLHFSRNVIFKINFYLKSSFVKLVSVIKSVGSHELLMQCSWGETPSGYFTGITSYIALSALLYFQLTFLKLMLKHNVSHGSLYSVARFTLHFSTMVI